MSYTQLIRGQRYQIKALMDIGQSQTEVAPQLEVNKSAISREGQRGYRPKQAHEIALRRRREKTRTNIGPESWAMVEEKIRKDWNPEQISGRFKKEGIVISHKRIFQYIYADKRVGGTLWTYLRCQKKRRRRYGKHDRRGKIPNRKSIEERPQLVEQRTRFGDWEVDLLHGRNQQGVMVILTERKSRFTLLHSLSSKQADLVAQTVIALLKWVAPLENITADNGKEFAAHLEISHALSVDFFFGSWLKSK